MKAINTKLLVSILALCSTVNLYSADENTENQDRALITATENADITENEIDTTVGEAVSFYIDTAVVDVEKLMIVAEKDRFYFVLNYGDTQLATVGQVTGGSLVIYNATLSNDQPQDDALNIEINPNRVTIPLEQAINCEHLEASFNPETRELIIFIPFTQTDLSTEITD